MFDAWDVALNGFLIPLLSDYWSLSVGQAAWIATANLIGMALGAFIWGGIADVIGRKKAFTLTLLVFSIFTVAGAFSPAFGWFILFRFLAGFGLGGCIPVDYALVGEFTPRSTGAESSPRWTGGGPSALHCAPSSPHGCWAWGIGA